MDTQEFRREHAVLLRSATRLAGLAATLQTRNDAVSVRSLIDGMNDSLVEHLTKEDTQLYPEMMSSEDQALQTMAREAFEDMGLLHGAWVAYRNQWSVDRILSEASTFNAATAALVKALATRIAMENDVLYPAAESSTLAVPLAARL